MLLTLKQAANELSCTYETARILVERGELSAIRLTERNIRIHPDALLAFINLKQKEAIKSCQLQKTQKQGATSVVSMIQRETKSSTRLKNTSRQE